MAVVDGVNLYQMLRDTLVWHEGSGGSRVVVASVISAVTAGDLGVYTRSPVVANYKLIIGLSPDPEWEDVERHGRAVPGRIDHDE